jgi:hypothetical protein
MPKIVINSDYGGFGLSEEAIKLYFKYKGWNLVTEETKHEMPLFYKDFIGDDNLFSEYNLERNDATLVRVVEELGDKANSNYSLLKIVEIPEGVHWYIEEYDGREHVAEMHRTWY